MGVVLKILNGKYTLVEGEAKVHQPVLALPTKPFYPRPKARGRKRPPRKPMGNAVCAVYSPDDVVLDIIDLSAQHFNVTVEDLQSHHKVMKLCKIRNTIYRLLYEDYGVTYQRIGSFFGNRDGKGVNVNLGRLKKATTPDDEKAYQFYRQHVMTGVDMIHKPFKLTVDA